MNARLLEMPNEPEIPIPVEAERAVLGAIILDSSVLPTASTLHPEDFGLDAHRLIFRAMLKESGSIDTVTLTETLARSRQIDAVGGVAYLTSLTDGVPRPTASNMSRWLSIVREASAKRHAIHTAEAIKSAAFDANTSTEQLAARFTEASSTLEQYQKPAAAMLCRVSDVASRSVDWLWEGRIPKGTITIFDGDPGRGKGLTVVDLTARVTTGRDMPDGTPGAIGPVIYLTTEDAVSFAVRPRLEVAGANLEHVHMLLPGAETLIRFPESCELLKRMVREIGAAMLIVDPLSAFLGEEINSHKDADIRRALTPLHQLAEETGVAIIGIRHFNKNSGGSAMYRGQGSIAIAAAARSLVTFGTDPEQESDRIMAWTKLNIASLPRSMRYQIVTAVHQTLKDKYGKPVEIAKIQWMGESDVRSDELVQAPADPERRSQTDEAYEIIGQLFGDATEVLSADADKAIREAGISAGTAHNARKRLGIRTGKSTFNGKWQWYLTRPLKKKGAEVSIEG